MKKLIPIFLIITVFFSCSTKVVEETNLNVSLNIVKECNDILTEVQIERHFTPPVAARNYAIPNMAGYAAIEPFYENLRPFKGQVRDFDDTFTPDLSQAFDLDMIYFKAFTEVALEITYSDSIMTEYVAEKTTFFKDNLSPEVFQRSDEYGSSVAKGILKFASTDNFKETRSMQQFALSEDTLLWRPTAPAYLPGVEPFWHTLRPYALDSANQFELPDPTPVSLENNSDFMAEVAEVMDALKTNNDERREIAAFWDCNPNIAHFHGHLMFFLKQLSPGAHWMQIGMQAAQEKNFQLDKGAATITKIAMVIHDGFIACWYDKYRTNYIRPETVIKSQYDKEWEPLLQTPAFPEYPSGHSVVSSASATVLTHIFGDNFAFNDSTELRFGLPVRSFNSFNEAAAEAAISRMYGGIHFTPAIENGQILGNNVGKHFIDRIQLMK
jgi:hypothetical protein